MPRTVLQLLLVAAFIPLRAQASDWWNADRNSMGIAPLPTEEPEALVQVYAARAFRWRGYFAVHCWVSIKEKGAPSYTNYHVMGWGSRTIRENHDLPDRRWYGADAELLYQLKGPAAERAIPQIRDAVASYPYPDFYRAWPGPNSNTFVSHIIRSTKELRFELPPHAIGKDWIGQGDLFGASESGTGLQFSVFGLFGLTLGLGEGIELNVLGLSMGVDFLRPALKLPLLGRLGMNELETTLSE